MNTTTVSHIDWIGNIQDCTGIKFNNDQIGEWLTNNEWIVIDREHFGYDTVTREQVCDSVAKQFGLPKWPTYSDGDTAFEIFIDELKRRAIKHGFEVEE